MSGAVGEGDQSSRGSAIKEKKIESYLGEEANGRWRMLLVEEGRSNRNRHVTGDHALNAEGKSNWEKKTDLGRKA